MSYNFCLKSKLKPITLKAKPDVGTLHRAWLSQLFVCMTAALRMLKFYEGEKKSIKYHQLLSEVCSRLPGTFLL